MARPPNALSDRALRPAAIKARPTDDTIGVKIAAPTACFLTNDPERASLAQSGSLSVAAGGVRRGADVALMTGAARAAAG